MGRGVARNLVAGMPQPAFVGGNRRALAVGAGDRDHSPRDALEPETLGDLAHALETEVDGFAMQNHLPFEPLVERIEMHSATPRGESYSGRACPISMVQSELIFSRIRRRSTIMSTAPWSSRNSLR